MPSDGLGTVPCPVYAAFVIVVAAALGAGLVWIARTLRAELGSRSTDVDRRRQRRVLGSGLEPGQGGGERAAGAEGGVHSAAEATGANGCSLGR